MDQQLIEKITKLSAEIAIKAAMDHLEKEKKKQLKVKKDWRLRNTKLLLKNYRSFVSHSRKIENEIELLKRAEVLDELYTEDFAVESIKRSKQRTKVMVEFIRRMLNVYKDMCEQSGKTEEIRRYQIIHALYISEQKQEIEAVAKCHKIDVRTVYRDIKEAVKTLSVLVFGVDGIRLEA
ncbi:hypothetical protein [Brevibacillus laterosporus]|uniref:Uncharacterized protein n=1 Tax=Brevibacillus laterosporus TaxID=1465 RepID=A0AAP3G6Q8_BRELA|nr:hypothetical protein [Brevibacillus laterosporus]MCR8979488.1 hypothetical protein [Brevibacillus laterosporus]MCZ0806643.1 hypothetical protein [Brevibacillus laterosporus]MCZ0825091.1 hypothetical protein [Brevibacillus laterosporus]MCZ0852071.1 hypothetical protein [Brevibacillus laterosporus]